jgi:hypothetical protein
LSGNQGSLHIVRKKSTDREVSAVKAIANLKKLPKPVVEPTGEIKAIQREQADHSRRLTLILTPEFWRRLELLAAQTNVPADTDEHTGETVPGIKGMAPEYLAAELLEVAILESWESRSMGKVRA